MNPDPRIQTCALCPKLCRHVCPVAVGTGREAATPTQIMTTLYRWTRGEVSPELAGAAVSLCTDCGACEAACGVDQPVPEILRRARLTLTEPAPITELARVEGGGTGGRLQPLLHLLPKRTTSVPHPGMARVAFAGGEDGA